jgi:hypothetical protein
MNVKYNGEEEINSQGFCFIVSGLTELDILLLLF